MSATSRRGTLAGVAAALAAVVGRRAVAAVAPAHADAQLLALCVRFHALNAKALATADDGTMHGIMGHRWDTSDEIEDIAARTPEGARAKARVALALLDENDSWDGSGDTRFAYAALRDIAGVS